MLSHPTLSRDQFGYSAINLAAGYGHTEVVELLLDHGANIESSDNVRASSQFEMHSVLLLVPHAVWRNVTALRGLLWPPVGGNVAAGQEGQHSINR